ncbi:unnamed protein product [Caenorhabditis angaria]|uniref:Rad21/Rec8-like protein N-terminal domain-containing protein n=1 Tax=Caenorhabditis angaria TaxID=860376 RepID=A0A9P1IZP6_9PELO|nr:unnamed protein product [Caenorhabditis angaria]
MFYAQFVLSKKGPLAKIWLAAHWEKKLSKAQIYETNVDEAVDEIIQPKSKMALRTTGHLLLGIVRIYSKKTKYLLADCNEAFLKIKLAFRPGQLDAPNEKIPYQTTFSSIPDMFGDFDATLPEFNEADYLNCQVSQSRVDDITLKEDNITEAAHERYNPTSFDDDDFGEAAAGVNFDEDYADFSGDVSFGFEFARDQSSAIDSLFGREREPTPCLDNAHAPGNAIFGEEDFGDNADAMDDEDQELTMDNNSEIMPISDHLDVDDNMSVKSFNTHTTSEHESYQLELMESYLERQERKKEKETTFG